MRQFLRKLVGRELFNLYRAGKVELSYNNESYTEDYIIDVLAGSIQGWMNDSAEFMKQYDAFRTELVLKAMEKMGNEPKQRTWGNTT